MTCANCEQLEHSCDTNPAVPDGGTCNDVLYTCPYDGQRWWQFNTHYHLWQRVDTDKVWEGLREELRNPVPPDLDY